MRWLDQTLLWSVVLWGERRRSPRSLERERRCRPSVGACDG
jgi:hypothetical protein